MLPFTRKTAAWILLVFLLGIANAAPIEEDDYFKLTLKQNETLQKFKQKVYKLLPEPYMQTDFYLIRWLKAKDFKLDGAEEMLTETLEWREENNISNILQEDFSDVSDDYRITTDTYDKFGRPITCFDVGSWDIRAAVVQGKIHRFTRYVTSNIEKVFQRIVSARNRGENALHSLTLLDFEGVNKVQHSCSACIPAIYAMVDQLVTHYTYLSKEVIIINAPVAFERVIQTASVLSPHHKRVIKVFNDQKLWMPYLDERIEKSQRYPNYGGTKQP